MPDAAESGARGARDAVGATRQRRPPQRAEREREQQDEGVEAAPDDEGHDAVDVAEADLVDGRPGHREPDQLDDAGEEQRAQGGRTTGSGRGPCQHTHAHRTAKAISDAAEVSGPRGIRRPTADGGDRHGRGGHERAPPGATARGPPSQRRG